MLTIKSIRRAAVFFVILFLFLRPVSGDGDLFHHLASGKYFFENSAVPRIDDYTFTANGKTWIAHSWGSGVLFYLFYKLAGLFGISFFVFFTAVLTFLLIWKLLKTRGIAEKTIFLLILLAAPLVSIRFPSRPEIMTYPLLLSLLIIGEKAGKKAQKKGSMEKYKINMNYF